MPRYAVEIIRLRPERLEIEIDAESAERVRELIPEIAGNFNGWIADPNAEIKYAIVKDGNDVRLITFGD